MNCLYLTPFFYFKTYGHNKPNKRVLYSIYYKKQKKMLYIINYNYFTRRVYEYSTIKNCPGSTLHLFKWISRFNCSHP